MFRSRHSPHAHSHLDFRKRRPHGRRRFQAGRRPVLRTIVICALILMVPALAKAQVIDTRAEVEAGRALYMTHCASCHGLEADGQGPMAAVLMVQPKALSDLTRTNAGTFPMQRVIERIDGRDPLVSHGSSMPVYGDFFQGDDRAMKADNGQPVLTSGPIVDLVTYLRSIQK